MTWCVVPAAGSGRRFGGPKPKQYQVIRGQPLLAWTLAQVARHARVSGFVVVIAQQDPWWPGWHQVQGKPIHTAIGGAERADSVLAGLRKLQSLPQVDDWVLVHDAARPCVSLADLDALFVHGIDDPVGAILASRVHDTVKLADAEGRVAQTLPRERLWRALTPQLIRRERLQYALEQTQCGSQRPTDEANAMETIGEFPLLVEGYELNLKVTSATDLDLASVVLARQLADVDVSSWFPVE